MDSQNLRKYLFENNYVFLKNFIDQERSIKISNEFKKSKRKNDNDVEKSSSLYNFMPSLEILCEKTPIISEILGEYVLPTYTFTRRYEKDSELRIHKDRESCEITLTVHLDSDRLHSWPIWIKTPSGQNKSIVFSPGDAMMYFGCESLHWREKYQGMWYNQTMLHYVRSKGSQSHRYFDKVNIIRRDKNLPRI